MSTTTVKLTVPRDTVETAPLIITGIAVSEPVLVSVEVQFAGDTNNLCGIRILSQGQQLCPLGNASTAEQWITSGQDKNAKRIVNEEMAGPNYTLDIEAYNTDEVYPHSVTVMLETALQKGG